LDKTVLAILRPEEVDQFRAMTLKILKSLNKTDHEADEYELVPGQLNKQG
jgi:hypothetical protein